MMDIINEVDNIEEDTQKDKYLIFTLGNENYGIDIKYVIEIIGMQSVVEVPELPSYIKGIINLRGKIIPVMDIRVRFKKEFREYDDRTCIIVVDICKTTIGLIVDRISEVVDITDENISPSPQIQNGFNHRYVKSIGRVGQSIKLLLDCEELLNEEEVEDIKTIYSEEGECKNEVVLQS